MPTPPLPDWITDAYVPGYVAAHRLCPDESRLFGTESLYGDWGGAVLLLAKDFGPTRIVRDRIAQGDPRPYRHEPTMVTNRRLKRLAEPLRDLGLLYGSALGNLLRDDGRVSGALPNRAAALDYGIKVVRFVLEHMPARRWIVCLGHEAWEHVLLAIASHKLGVHHPQVLLGVTVPGSRMMRSTLWQLSPPRRICSCLL